jgi:hypothetical protein
MLYALDLTHRQARRVLEQAARSRAELQIELRNMPAEAALCATVEMVDDQVILARISECPSSVDAALLVGVYCDIATTMSTQMYLFDTYVIDAKREPETLWIRLARPQSIQVANRRAFQRRTVAQSSRVELLFEDGPDSFYGDLCNISGKGLGCRLPRELDGILLIGDQVRLKFTLAGILEQFNLPAIICNKTPTGDRSGLIVGLEFDDRSVPEQGQVLLERLRSFLCDADFSTGKQEDA